MSEVDRSGDPQTGDFDICRDGRGELDSMLADLGGELNRADLKWAGPPERRVTGTDGSLSVGEELQRLLDESLRGLRVSSRSLNVRI